MPDEKPREIAAHILKRHAEGREYLESLLETALCQTPLSAVDRGLVQELTFGVVRWQATLDWLIARKTGSRPQKLTLQILLRLGLYQLFWLERIPDHAAVNETVELARVLGFGPQAGFVNAVLRCFLRERGETHRVLEELKSTQPALGFSHPDWLCDRWEKRWGAKTVKQLLEWNNTPPATYARVNTLKTDAPKLIAQWDQEGVQFARIPRLFPGSLEGLVFELKAHPPLASLPSLQQGLFYVQDPSTLLAVLEMNPQPGETVLDLCAAPGGKTTFLAQLMENRGRIIAQDTHPQRRQMLRENCVRLGATCVECSAPATIVFPALSLAFDRVLVDAPCSNTGVMRRRVDLRWRIRPEEIERLRKAQLRLLHDAAVQVKPGGTLVYSTCSLEPEENGGVVRQFLSEHIEFRLERERELLPFVEGVDGAYVARMVRAV